MARLRNLVAAVVLVAAGYVWAASGDTSPDAPYCPTEDSCIADYRDGAWHIAEVSP